LDLRTPNILDPPSVTAAREKEASILHMWLQQIKQEKKMYKY